MFKPKSVTTTYEVTLQEVKSLFCKELGVDESKVVVQYNISTKYAGNYDEVGTKYVSGLTITVAGQKPLRDDDLIG